ncbi:MAG: methyl-accepting chemotaxis protein [Pseudomonas sp.]|uniref:methyl-accepting chemotaxis protein n=1 Tax=Pseudomonas sp. TaxID=306 RepID=UPI002736759D|nr:methyl-accepting chemotaxis protein [Pseudomonas sp.]MDP3848329.1 methyl-accepting chemotaxis protein [Pseudomonas sp.]
MMGKITNLSIGSKLMLAFGGLILGFGALLLTSLEHFTGLQEAEELQFKRRYERMSDVKELLSNLNLQRTELLEIVAEGPTGNLKSHEQEIRQRTETNSQLLEQLRAGVKEDPATIELLDQLQSTRAAYLHTRDSKVLPLLRSERLEEARGLIAGEHSEQLARLRALGQQLAERTNQRVTDGLEQSRQALAVVHQRILQLGLLLIVAAAVLAWLLSRHIAQPLARLTGWAEQISGGEIPREMTDNARQDEVGRLGQAFTCMGRYLQALAAKAEAMAQGQLHEDSQQVAEQDVLGRAFATMVGNLRRLVLELNEGIAVLAASSEEILAVTTQVAASTQETATAISEIATTVAEVKQTAILAGGKSQSVVESTGRSRQVALGGRQALDETLKGMRQIREQMQAVAESIMRLGEQSQSIGEIVASVNDLAEQSNLLGVNASIEAVKAGEVGKGFSVVAQEVKTLAEQSKQATAQVRGILSEIQKAMSKAVLQAEQGSKTVESGYQRAEVSGEAIRTLSSSIEESSEMALQIAATSQQQMIGMDQIGSAMESIHQASQDNVGGTRQVDLAARNLHQLGLKLKGLAAQFKL